MTAEAGWILYDAARLCLGYLAEALSKPMSELSQSEIMFAIRDWIK